MDALTPQLHNGKIRKKLHALLFPHMCIFRPRFSVSLTTVRSATGVPQAQYSRDRRYAMAYSTKIWSGSKMTNSRNRLLIPPVSAKRLLERKWTSSTAAAAAGRSGFKIDLSWFANRSAICSLDLLASGSVVLPSLVLTGFPSTTFDRSRYDTFLGWGVRSYSLLCRSLRSPSFWYFSSLEVYWTLLRGYMPIIEF